MDKKRKIPNQNFKKVYIRGLVVIGLACTLLFSLHLKGNSGETKDMLQNPIPFYRVEKLPFSWAVRSSADETNVPICLEIICIPRILGRTPELKVNLEMKNATPREILDALVAKDPRYFWYEDNGIINFLPREVKEDKTYPLNRKLSRFKVKAKSLWEAGRLLSTQAQKETGLTYGQFLFIKTLKKWTLSGRPSGITLYYPNVQIFYRMTSITLDLKDATLRDILNAIARQIGDCYWVYTGKEGHRRFTFIPFSGRLDLHPKISFEKRECNFGQVTQGDKIACTFKVKNIGIDSLEIDSVAPSYRDSTPPRGCPSRSWFNDYKRILMPSEEATVKVTFASEGREGPQLLLLKVYSNDPDKPVTELIMNGTVVAE